jgi:8-oxo-dGTP pyrophosphatase MutT (NUDIX family)
MTDEHSIGRAVGLLRRRLADADFARISAPALETDSAKPAAVLVPLFPSGNELHALYIRRSDTVATHQGQVAFPGGHVEPTDGDLLAAALREAHEEVGIRPASVEVLGALGTMRTGSGDFMVTPFVGLIPGTHSLRRDPREVAEIFDVPLSALRDPRYRGSHTWGRNGGPPSDYPAILYQGQVIWGLTFRFTMELLAALDSTP